MQNYFIFFVVIIHLCSYRVNIINAHLASACYAIPNSSVVYTRDTGYTDDFYVWASSYHAHGTYCYQTGYYNEQRLVVTINGIPVTREGGDGTKCSSNTISNFSGTYLGGNTNMGGNPAQYQDPNCYDTYTGKYLGQGDAYLKRDHCSGGQGFTGKWFELLPVRLRAMDTSNQNTQTINKIQLKGWGCEGLWFAKEYTVQYGCPKGTWEDTSTAWSDTSSASYCKPCPPGYYSIHANAKIQKGTSGQAACTACPKGKFGDENQYPNRDTADYCQACPAGRYGDAYAISDSQCSGECKKGFYCPSNVLNTHPYGGTPGTQLEITAGHYGAAGSTSATPHVCPAGYFCPQGSGDTDCTSATTWTSSTLKDSRCKHLCGQGSGCEQNVNVGSSTCYCPNGSTTPLFVDPGFYSSGSGNDNHVVMTRDTQTPCNPGNYCLGGICSHGHCDGWYHPCPVGKYGSTTGIKHPGGITDPNHPDYNFQCLPYVTCDMGTYVRFNGNTSHDRTCANCSSGTFGNETNADSCHACAYGQYQNIEGQSTCWSTCDMGTYVRFNGNTSHDRTCANCSSGTFGNETNADSCHACAYGQYQNIEGQSTCKVCDVGQFAITRKRCQGWSTCDMGTYVRFNGNTSHDRTCANCSSGTFGNETNADSCHACAYGQYQNATGKTNCVQCPVGRYGIQLGAIVLHTGCRNCSTGTYGNVEGAPSNSIGCSKCLLGTYAASTGLTNCTGCPIGKYGILEGGTNESIACNNCSTGRYGNVTAATTFHAGCNFTCGTGKYGTITGAYNEPNACTDCPLGMFGNGTGASSCHACAYGQYQNATGKANCVQCPVGTYGDALQAKTKVEGCSECTAGLYQDDVGQVTCKVCDGGKFAITRKRCQDWTVCDMGTYIYFNGNASHDRTCNNCSRGTYAGTQNLEKCSVCRANMFQNTTGQVNCTNCPTGKFTKPATIGLRPRTFHDNLYDCWYPPKILSLTPGNTTTKGRINTSMYGEHFGTPNSTIILAVGGTIWQARVMNSTWIQAWSSPGSGKDLRIAVTIDGIVGTSKVTFSYTPPRIGNITSPPFNGGTMQILGSDFVDQGIAINIYEDGCVRSCSNIQFISDTKLQCQYNGVGTKGETNKKLVTVSVDGQTSNGMYVRYDADRGDLVGVPFNVQRVNEDNNIEYSISLSLNPAASVLVNLEATVLNPTTHPTTTCTVSPSQILFNNRTSTAVTVSVGGNQVDEGTNAIAFQCKVTHSIVSSDPQFTNIPSRYMEVNVVNDDIADAYLWTYNEKEKKFGYQTRFVGTLCNDEGKTLKYGVRLNTEPTHNVRITPVIVMVNNSVVYLPPQVILNQHHFVFGPSNWSTTQLITAHSLQNHVDHDDIEFKIEHTITSDDTVFVKKATQLALQTVFTILDDDVAGIDLSTDVLTLQEAAAGTASITFNGVTSKPVADVLVKVEVDSSLIVVEPSSFVIPYDGNITNVDIWKSINKQIAFRARTGASSTTARIVCISDDMKYNVTSEKVSIIVQPLQRSLNIPKEGAVEEGKSYTYKLSLTTAPLRNVTIKVSVVGKCTISTTELRRVDGTETSITVHAPDNVVDEGRSISYTCTINHTLLSADSAYNGQTHLLNLPVANNDVADAKLWTFNTDENAYDFKTKFVGPLCNAEGSIVQYGVQLDTEPMHLVYIIPKVIMLNKSHVVIPPKLSLSTHKLVFSPANWSTIQPVIVQSMQDNVDNDNIKFQIVHNITSDDAVFVKKTSEEPLNVVFTVTDDDVSSIRLNTNVLTVQEAAASATSITFNGVTSKPVADVLVKVEVDSNLIAVSPSSFMIRYDSNITNVDIWKRINKQIAFRAATGATSTTARIVCISDDRKYNVTSEKVSIIVQPLQRSLNVPKEGAVEEGKSYTYKLSLTTTPTAPVTIQLRMQGNCSLSTNRLDVAGKAEQVIIVQAPNNFVDEGSNAVSYTCKISHIMSSTDVSYNGQVHVTQITVLDDDVADVKVAAYSLESESFLASVNELGPLCLDEGKNGTYGIVLESQPLDTVHISSSVKFSRVGSPLRVHPPALLKVEPTEWNKTHYMHLMSIHDFIDNDLLVEDFEIHHSIATNDTVFLMAATNATTLFQITDHPLDVAALQYRPTANTIRLNENANYRLTASLNSLPRHAVKIQASILQAQPNTEMYVSVTSSKAAVNSPDEEVIFTVSAAESNYDLASKFTLVVQVSSTDKPYNFNDTFDVEVMDVEARPPTPDPPNLHIEKDGLLLKWEAGKQQMYEIQWSRERTFFKDINATKQVETTLTLPWASSKPEHHVTYFRIRVLGTVGNPNSEWSALTEGWATTKDCDRVNEYLNMSGGLYNWKCNNCPMGGDCVGEDITWKDVKPVFGFWRIEPWSADRYSNFSECLYPLACLGGRNNAMRGKFVVDDVDYSMKDLPEGCNYDAGYEVNCTEDGAIGRCRLCATCKKGYRHKDVSGILRCDKCPDAVANKGLLVLGVVVVFAVMCAMVFDHIGTGGKKSLHQMQKVIIINYLQMTFMIANMDVPWHDPMMGVFDFQGAISTIGEHLLNPVCELQDKDAAYIAYGKQIGYLVAVPCMVGVIIILWRVIGLCQGRPYKYRGPNGQSPSLKDGSVATIVFLMYLMYPTLCRQSFSLMVCHAVGDKHYLLADMQEPCFEGRHLWWFIGVTVPQIMLYVIGFPAIGLYVVWYEKQKLVRKSRVSGGRRNRAVTISAMQRQQNTMGSTISLFKYGMLYSSYSPNRWYWDAFIGLRKAFVAFLTSYMSLAQLEIHFIGLVLLLYIVMNEYGKPYSQADGKNTTQGDSLQRLDTMSLVVCAFTAWSGLFFVLYPYCTAEDNLSCYMLMWVVFSVNVAFLVYCASLFRKKVYNALRNRLCRSRGVEGSDIGGVGKKLSKHVVEIEMSRGSSVHANPLKYRRSFVEKQETENPVFGTSMTMNPVSTVARRSARQSAMEEMTSNRLSRLRRVRESQRSQAEESCVKEVSDEDMLEDGMFVDNPMIKK